MSAARQAIFLLPIYDEEARLEALLERIAAAPLPPAWGLRLLAVDDGSRDGSAAILARRTPTLPLVVVTHAVNRGLAEALRTGLAWVAANAADGDAVVSMDADDTHDPAHAAAMLERIEAGFDLVLASRFQPGAAMYGVAPHRQLYGNAANAILRATLAVPGVSDYGCGFRAMSAPLVRRAVHELGPRLLELHSWGFICTAELVWKLSWFAPRIAEVPLTLHYDLKQSASKMPSARTIGGYGLLAAKGLGRRISNFEF